MSPIRADLGGGVRDGLVVDADRLDDHLDDLGAGRLEAGASLFALHVPDWPAGFCGPGLMNPPPPPPPPTRMAVLPRPEAKLLDIPCAWACAWALTSAFTTTEAPTNTFTLGTLTVWPGGAQQLNIGGGGGVGGTQHGGGTQLQPPATAHGRTAAAAISPKARHPAAAARMDLIRAPMLGLNFRCSARGENRPFGPSPRRPIPGRCSLVQIFHASPMRPSWPQKAGL